MTEEGAIERAEQLRRAVAATRVSHGASQITVTASFGVASFPLHGRTTDELIAAADSALYSAKSEGRNRVSARVEPCRDADTPERSVPPQPPI